MATAEATLTELRAAIAAANDFQSTPEWRDLARQEGAARDAGDNAGADALRAQRFAGLDPYVAEIARLRAELLEARVVESGVRTEFDGRPDVLVRAAIAVITPEIVIAERVAEPEFGRRSQSVRKVALRALLAERLAAAVRVR